jgi:two-component system OmpR family response regulator
MSPWTLDYASESLDILVIEDEMELAHLICLHLADWKARVTVVNDGCIGRERASNGHWNAILLDLRLPVLDGMDLCRALRREGDTTPILMVTSRDTELDRVMGLEAGADDYLTKPFSFLELKARLKALLRRAAIGQAPKEPERTIDHTREFAPLHLNRTTRSARLNGQEIVLTAREFELLWHFMSHPGTVFSRMDLLDQVWGIGFEGYEHTVNSHINRLRSKLEGVPQTPPLIHTVWGVGYRFGQMPVQPLQD